MVVIGINAHIAIQKFQNRIQSFGLRNLDETLKGIMKKLFN
jgi:hypothetical protein